jgi:hypothetical protein
MVRALRAYTIAFAKDYRLHKDEGPRTVVLDKLVKHYNT